MSFTTEQIRTLAVAGHGQTGKTTLVEHLLQTAGVIPKAETVESGKTVSDFTPEEIERKISIRAALANLDACMTELAEFDRFYTEKRQQKELLVSQVEFI